MKKIKSLFPLSFILFTFTFLLLPFAFILADTIIVSVYSDPVLDGYIYFSQNNQSYSVNNWMYDMGAGDTFGFGPFSSDPNSYFRSFLSFYLPEIPEQYYVDSVYVRLYQYASYGYDASTGQYTDFPVWNVAGGDTIKCILSHIDYGISLDAGDWAKGDVGHTFTYRNNVGTVTESGGFGYRYVDVTDCVVSDYEMTRDKTQYRIAFQIDTDWDVFGDSVIFTTSNGYPPNNSLKPLLHIRFTNEINSIEEHEIPYEQKVLVRIHPNPVRADFNISFSRKDFVIEKLEIFNIKGQKVKSVNCSEISNSGITIDCSTIPSGIYFLKVSSGTAAAVRKLLIMK